MPPSRRIIRARDVDLGERVVRIGKRRVQPYRFQEQPERLVLLQRHAIQLRQVIVRPRIAGSARNPGALLVHLLHGLVIERKLDHLFTPETHLPDPTRISRTSITLVPVGPVLTRSPSPSK